MPTAVDSGTTATLVIGTETTLFDTSAAGDYVCQVDMSPMLAGDIVVVRARVITLSTDTVPGGIDIEEWFSDVQLKTIFRTYPVPTELATAGAVRFTITQTAGTGRAFKHKVLAL